MRICESALCTVCGACQNICPRNCISMKLDDEGFLKFHINEERCIQCNLCIGTCPANGYNDFVVKTKPTAFLCWNLNDNVRRQSSSGGIFTLLAEQTLGDNGIVFGASFDEQFNVRHVGIESNGGLSRLRGSKYVQSYTGRTL